MKLSEIKLAEDITNLIESLDSHYPFREIASTTHYKKFRIEKVKINVTINFYHFKKLKIAELLFASDDFEYAVLSIRPANEVFAIFGSLLKIVKEIPDVNIWNFAAKHDHDDSVNYLKRVQFYNRLSKRIADDHDLVVTSRIIRGDTIYVISNAPVDNSQIIDFMNDVQK